MMRELDTVSPVVWPAWCYSGEGQGDVESAGANTELHQQASAAVATAAVATPKPRGKRRGAPASATAAMNGGGDHHNNNNNNNNNIPVKTERLSPSTTSATASANTPDNSSSSRSATPSSSYPGTPPSVPAERGASPAPSPAGHLKHMEQMMTRNYSDFMRSLAAKYNNANPNDYFSTPARNGYPVTLDPRFSSFKAGNTPFVGLMAPLATTTTTMSSPIHKNNNSIASANNSTSSGATTSTTASTKDSCPDSHHVKKEAIASVEAQQALYAAAASSFAPNPFATRAATNPGMFPPMIDMSSTHALLNMVRTANAHNASQLETYLKGAIKRPAPSESTPLDLSSASLPTYTKKSRTIKSMSASDNMFIKSESLLNIPMMDVLRTTKKRLGSVSPKPPSRGVGNSGGSSAGSSPRLGAAATVTSQHAYGRSLPCMSVCTNSERPCSGSADSQTVAHWTVDDVCNFVASIDNCAEYSQHFREQLIDGSSLPLLTEEHLTNTMSMKLGPALKLRATLARRLGHCAVCLHCVHCHSAPTTLPAPVSPAQTPPASSLARPSSTGVYQERAVAPHGILTVASPN